jgi:hypothetical protein
MSENNASTNTIIPITLTSPSAEVPISRTVAAPAASSAPKVQSNSRYPTEVVSLPSEGYFYAPNDPLAKGEIEIKMMTAREEDILTNEALIKKGTVLNKLLEALVVDKSIKLDNLLISDKIALFIAARRLAYGDSYGPVKVTCAKCREENDTVIDLADFKSKEFDFSQYTRGVNAFEFVLPFAKRTVQVKLLTTNDEAQIDAELKGLSKVSRNTNNTSEVTTRLKYIIVSVDGNTDREFIRRFVDNELLSRDTIELRKFIRGISPEIDTYFNFECSHCNHLERTALPFTAQFFWPDAGI